MKKLLLILVLLSSIYGCNNKENLSSEVLYFSCVGHSNFRETDRDKFSNPKEKSYPINSNLIVIKKKEIIRDRKPSYLPFFLRKEINVFGSLKIQDSSYEICNDEVDKLTFSLSCDQSSGEEIKKMKNGKSYSFGYLDKLSMVTMYEEDYFDESKHHQNSWMFNGCKKIDKPLL